MLSVETFHEIVSWFEVMPVILTLPGAEGLTVSAATSGLEKEAMTVISLDMRTRQVNGFDVLGVQFVHPVNVDPEAGEAVRLTKVP